MRAELKVAGTQTVVGSVALVEGGVDVHVKDERHRTAIQKVFETGEITYAWVGYVGGEMQEAKAKPMTRTWFGAILLQVLPQAGYVWTWVDDSPQVE